MKIYLTLTIILNGIILGLAINILYKHEKDDKDDQIQEIWEEITKIYSLMDRLDKNTTEKLLCEKHIEAEVDPYFGTPMKTKEILCSEEVVKVLGGKYYKVIKTLKKIDDKIEYRVKEI